jgi:V8-like Glu-specific endopeptidase
MKTRNILLFFIIVSINAAIYDNDDRVLVFDSQNTVIKEMGLSIAAKLRTLPTPIGDEKYQIKSKLLRNHIDNLCDGERFANVETISNCTGFLVTEDLMVTAGHCINTQKECDESTWLFSSHINPYEKDPIVSESNIFKCKNIVSRIKNSISKNDYTLFKLTKAVKKRNPLKFRKEGRVNQNDNFMVLGHPTGLPLIETRSTKVLQNDSAFLFRINSDTFGGNSGSPVFNQKTGLVEGILTDGDSDYRLNKKRGCLETYQCPKNGCKGENVVRITNIPELVPDMTPVEPVVDLNNLRL